MSENSSLANQTLDQFISDKQRGNGKHVGDLISKDIDEALKVLLYRAEDKKL